MEAHGSTAFETYGGNAPDLRWGRIAGVLALVAVAALAGWYFLIRDGAGSVPQPGAGPVEASASSLESLQDRVGHSVYWAEPTSGTKLEATETSDGRIFVRFLHEDGAIGDPNPGFLTVGTYQVENAARVVEELAAVKGALTSSTPDGRLVVTNRNTPTSVYLADPGENLQVEIYHPDPSRAFELATSGQIVPVD
jgi:hypothetical protein